MRKTLQFALTSALVAGAALAASVAQAAATAHVQYAFFKVNDAKEVKEAVIRSQDSLIEACANAQANSLVVGQVPVQVHGKGADSVVRMGSDVVSLRAEPTEADQVGVLDFGFMFDATLTDKTHSFVVNTSKVALQGPVTLKEGDIAYAQMPFYGTEVSQALAFRWAANSNPEPLCPRN